MSAGFAQIRRFLRDTAGVVFEDNKRYFVEDRLNPVLRASGLANLDDLARSLHLDRQSDIARTVTEALMINETSFFRDRPLFTALSERLLPHLLKEREATRQLRVWCAGCSTGQEPYSVAMVFDEVMRQRSGWRVEILATDVSRSVIEQARRGTYSQFEVQRGLPVALLLRHFARRGEAWQISDYLRAKVTFKTLNLMSIPPDAGCFDIIFCRNVLFYFDDATKRRVLNHIAQRLAPDGILVLGGGERLGDLCPALQSEPAAPFMFVHAKPSACSRAVA